MAKIKKYAQDQNLAGFRTWIVDTNPSSRYFRLTQLPDTLTAGKNAFLINGSPELVSTTDVLVELVDASGRTIFLQPIKNYAEGLARIVSIEVYASAAPGLATLTILGHLARDEQGNVPPDEFINAYNVKWQKQLVVAPTKINSTPVRLYEVPTVAVAEVLTPFRSASNAAPVTVSTGSISLFTYLNTPGIEATRTTRFSFLTGGATASRQFVSGTLTATVNGQPYTASIIDVVNATTALLSASFTPSQSANVTPSSYAITYTPMPTFIAFAMTRSYAEIVLNKLTTFSGDAQRARVYARSVDQNSDYQLIGDVRLSPRPFMVTQSVATGEQDVEIGQFTSQSIINSHWTAGMVSGSVYLSTGSVSLTADSTVLLDAATVNTGSVSIASALPRYFFGPVSAFAFTQGHEYSITGRLVGVNPSAIDTRIDVYLVGSAFPSSSMDGLGQKVVSFTLSAVDYRKEFICNATIAALNSGTAYLRYVIYAGNWYAQDVSVDAASEFGFNPDEARVLVPVLGRRLETLQFKIELLDVNSNLVPVDIESAPIFFNGGNFIAQGDDNRLLGEMRIGGLTGAGIVMTTKGYTSSVGPVPNAPAIYIGAGQYGNANTPFFVGSGSNGVSVMSLGDQFKWDGTTLFLSGGINITNSGSFDTRLSAVEISASLAAASASAAASSASANASSASQASASAAAASASAAAASSSVSAFDSRIFTDSTGRIIKTPFPSASGLYLGATFMGYYNGVDWKTYMSDTGNFFLTGSGGHWLTWNGGTLTISGDITIVSGPTYNNIQNAASTASNAQTSASNAQISASAAAISASNAALSASRAATSASNAQTSASAAQATASNASSSIAGAQATASQAYNTASIASSSAALANISASLIDGRVFTDSSGKLARAANPSGQGLFLGSTFLGYYSGSGWKTFMADNGNFFLTGSSSNFLSWNGSTLSIAGDITILSGVTYTQIQNTATTASNASSSVAGAVSSASAASSQAQAASATASAAASSASNALSTASIASSSAALAVQSASLLDTRIFTDASGQIVKTPNPTTTGLYLGSTFLGYYSGSGWKTFMSNTGNFFLTGSSSNFLAWDGSTLQIAGAITILSGQTFNNISNAQATASNAINTASNAASTASNASSSVAGAVASASVATTASNAAAASASAASSSAAQAATSASRAATSASAAAVSASQASQTASLLDPKVFTDSTGKIVRTPSPSGQGLFLGSTFLGYYSGSNWKTYMADNGNFFLTGSSSNFLAWNGTTLQIAGDITILTGTTYNQIQTASSDALNAVNTSNTAQQDAVDAQIAATNAQGVANAANNTANTAQTTASLAATTASNAQATASTAQSSASRALTSASNAQTTANAASSSAALANQSASLLDSRVFTDSTGRIVKTPSTSSAGLYLGSTFLGYFSGSAWRTFMSDTGNFFLTGSGANFLAWSGSTLTIAGNINILGGQAATDISNASTTASRAATTASNAQSTASSAQTTANTAQTTATNAQTTASNASTTASNAALTASSAQTTASNASTTASNAALTASNAQTTASRAATSASNAQTTASSAQTTASNAAVTASSAASTASIAQTTASQAYNQAIATNNYVNTTVVPSIFTDSTGRIVTPMNGGATGLYLDSTHLGYFSASQWLTYMSNTGNFFLTGSSSNFLAWNGTTLTIAGNITILGGQAATDIINAQASASKAQTTASNAQSTASSAQTAASNAQSTASSAQTTANTAQTTANTAQTTATAASSSAVTASLSASRAQTTASQALSQSVSTNDFVNNTVLPTIFTDSTGRITKPMNGGASGLYLGSSFMGFFSASSWRTYMSDTGNFFLTGSSSNFLAWNGGTLTIAGNINILGGQAATDISTAQTTANQAQTNAGSAQTTANQATSSAATAQTTANTAQASANTAQVTANNAQNAAGNASASAALANQSASLIDAKVFTDSTGRIIKAPQSGVGGLFLGSTFMGYHDGSSWKTYMANNGNFFLAGAGQHSLSWATDTLTVRGNITADTGSFTGTVNAKGGLFTGFVNVGTTGSSLAPNNISGLRVWLKADSLTGLTDGQTILTWTDSSGNGNTGIHGNNGPKFYSSTVNGLPVARFNGVNAESIDLPNTVFSGMAEGEMFIVLKSPNDQTAHPCQFGGPGLGYSLYPANTHSIYEQFGISTNQGPIDATAFNLKAFHVYNVSVTSGGVLTNRINQTQLASIGGLTVQFPTASISIGNYTYFTGDIAEIVIFNRALASSERAGLYAHLMNKYAVAGGGGAIPGQPGTVTVYGDFYLTGSAANYLQWSSGSLTVAGNVTITGGQAATDISNAFASASKAQVSASNASSSAALANQSASLLDLKIFTNNSGTIVRPPNTGSAGLYIGSTHMGYYNSAVWKTYMANNGNFYLAGNGLHALGWDGSTLALRGNITADTGSFTGEIKAKTGQILGTLTVGSNTGSINTGSSPANIETSSILYWMKADALTGYQDSNAVQIAPDFFGGNVEMTQIVSSASPIYKVNIVNGLPALYFDGGDYWNALGLDMSALGEAEMFVVIKPDNYPPSTDPTTGLWDFAPASNVSNTHYSYTDSIIYESFGRTSRISFTPTLNLASKFRVYNIAAKQGATYDTRLDGVSQFSDSGNVAFPTSAPLFGKSRGDYYLKGYVAEIILYKKKLTSQQRLDIEAHLSLKYALNLASAANLTPIPGNIIVTAFGSINLQGSGSTPQSAILGPYPNVPNAIALWLDDTTYPERPKIILNGQSGTGMTAPVNLVLGGNAASTFGGGDLSPAVYIDIGGLGGPGPGGSMRDIVMFAPEGVKVQGGNLTCQFDIIAFSTSDIRQKKTIRPITNPIGKIKRLSGNTFEWNENSPYFGQQDVGVIAQEVEEVLPEIVSERAPMKYGEPSYKAVDYERLIPLLIEGIKELTMRIELLERHDD